jgi:uncharacterized membrane protein
MSIAILLHVLASVVWVGGMFFAYMCLRPVAASMLEPPVRLTLWDRVFARFFPWVWLSVALILATGFWILFEVLGGFATAGWHVHTMLALGLVMMGIYAHVFFAPYRRLKKAVAAQDWPAGGKQLATIRRLVGINTILGIVTISVGAGGRYIAFG